jgi:hypothetical protein
MESYQIWDRRLSEAAAALGFDQGYKILYVPWSSIGTTDTVFLSLNPGRPPLDAVLSTLSDERGNSYEVEAETTLSPLTMQFLKLAEKLSLKPIQILTGAVVPFRSARWNYCSLAQRVGALEIGKEFWRQVFGVRRPQRVIACGNEAAQIATNLLGAELNLEIASNWGNTKLRRYQALDGSSVIQLPHLSTFKLFSRAECDGPIGEILK